MTTMTREMETYVTTLNLFGSDVIPELQPILDYEHALAEPEFAAELNLRRELKRAGRLKFEIGVDTYCGIFETSAEKELYALAAKCWNELQALIKAATAVTHGGR